MTATTRSVGGADVVPLRPGVSVSAPGGGHLTPDEIGPDVIGRFFAPLGAAVGLASRAAGAAIGGVADGVRSLTGRVETGTETDDWGLDPALVDTVHVLSRIRWDVSTGGADRIPKRRGALIVVNSPRFAQARLFATFALSEATGRPVRFVGRGDDDLLGALGRRIGGLLHEPEEVLGALRADELVVLDAETSTDPRHVGIVDHTIVGAALLAGVRVFPSAVSSTPFARHARVEVGRAVSPPRHRRGPLAELEMSDRLRDAIHGLLQEMGDISTGTPLDWLPLSGIGAH